MSLPPIQDPQLLATYIHLQTHLHTWQYLQWNHTDLFRYHLVQWPLDPQPSRDHLRTFCLSFGWCPSLLEDPAQIQELLKEVGSCLRAWRAQLCRYLKAEPSDLPHRPETRALIAQLLADPLGSHPTARALLDSEGVVEEVERLYQLPVTGKRGFLLENYTLRYGSSALPHRVSPARSSWIRAGQGLGSSDFPPSLKAARRAMKRGHPDLALELLREISPETCCPEELFQILKYASQFESSRVVGCLRDRFGIRSLSHLTQGAILARDTPRFVRLFGKLSLETSLEILPLFHAAVGSGSLVIFTYLSAFLRERDQQLSSPDYDSLLVTAAGTSCLMVDYLLRLGARPTLSAFLRAITKNKAACVQILYGAAGEDFLQAQGHLLVGAAIAQGHGPILNFFKKRDLPLGPGAYRAILVGLAGRGHVGGLGLALGLGLERAALEEARERAEAGGHRMAGGMIQDCILKISPE